MMAEGTNPREWPTLNDSNNATSAVAKNKQYENLKTWPSLNDSTAKTSSTGKKDHPKAKSEDNTDASGSENSGMTPNGKMNGARKKTGKIKWSRVPIEILSYRDNRSEKQYYESNRYPMNGRRSSSNESTTSLTNGLEQSKGRSYRGGKHPRGNSQFRSRRENIPPAEIRRYARVPQDVESISELHTDLTQSDGPMDPTDVVKEQVKRQIEYYFSEKNLVKDTYLRCHLDEQGYAKISLIASFPRIKSLTSDVQLIVRAVKESSYLEVSENKVRPVVDPLRWPLKNRLDEANSISSPEPYLDLVSGQLFNLCLDPTAYHPIAAPKCDLTNEFAWQFIPVDNLSKNDTVYCPLSTVYPQIDSNGVGGDVSIPNGHACPVEIPDMSSDPASQLVSGDVSPVVPSNDVEGTFENSNISNGDACTDNVLSSPNCDSVEEQSCLHPVTDSQIKNSSVICTVNGNHSQADPEENVVINDSLLNGHACSPISEVDAYNCYYEQEQLTNGVIMYNGGRYYITPSNEILSSSSDSSDDKSVLHNKSPEPTR